LLREGSEVDGLLEIGGQALVFVAWPTFPEGRAEAELFCVAELDW
jgi:hypothetical protein